MLGLVWLQLRETSVTIELPAAIDALLAIATALVLRANLVATPTARRSSRAWGWLSARVCTACLSSLQPLQASPSPDYEGHASSAWTASPLRCWKGTAVEPRNGYEQDLNSNKDLQLSFQQERRLCRSTAVQNTDVLKMKATSRACAPVRKGSLFGIKVVLGGLRSVVCLGGILILLHVLGRVSLPALVLSEARCCCVKS